MPKPSPGPNELDAYGKSGRQSKRGISLGRLGRQSRQHQRVFRRPSKIARFLQGTPDIRIFWPRVERNQSHAMQALGLIARFYSLRPVAEHLATVGADDLYSVGQEILRSKMQNLMAAAGMPTAAGVGPRRLVLRRHAIRLV